MIHDDINKAVILTRVDTALLIKIVKGGEHLRLIAARELCRRGWRGEVGFILDNQSSRRTQDDTGIREAFTDENVEHPPMKRNYITTVKIPIPNPSTKDTTP